MKVSPIKTVKPDSKIVKSSKTHLKTHLKNLNPNNFNSTGVGGMLGLTGGTLGTLFAFADKIRPCVYIVLDSVEWAIAIGTGIACTYIGDKIEDIINNSRKNRKNV